MNRNHFLIFSLCRSGSTNLALALDAQPGIRCLREPFNPDEHGDTYLAQVVDETTLRRCVHQIRLEYNGIKHVFHPSGWPFGKLQELNRFLVGMHDQKVVFIRRRNVLKRLVSYQISCQSKVWHLHEEESPDRFRDFRFGPLDIDLIRSELSKEYRVLADYSAIAARSSAGLMTVWYEDLYAENGCGDLAASLNEIQKILAFLGHAPAEPEVLHKMAPYLAPQSRLNSVESYSRVPNIHEVERLCGCDETGWLFQN
jgi:hypothetical protein